MSPNVSVSRDPGPKSKRTSTDEFPLSTIDSALRCFTVHILARDLLSIPCRVRFRALCWLVTALTSLMVLASHLLVKSFAFVLPGSLNWGFVRGLVFSFIPFLYIINGCICLSRILWCFDTYTGCSWFRSTSPKFSSIFFWNGHHVGDLFDAQYTHWGINLYILSFSVVFWAGYYTAQADLELFISYLSVQPSWSGARDAPAWGLQSARVTGGYPALLRFVHGSRMHVWGEMKHTSDFSAPSRDTNWEARKRTDFSGFRKRPSTESGPSFGSCRGSCLWGAVGTKGEYPQPKVLATLQGLSAWAWPFQLSVCPTFCLWLPLGLSLPLYKRSRDHWLANVLSAFWSSERLCAGINQSRGGLFI